MAKGPHRRLGGQLHQTSPLDPPLTGTYEKKKRKRNITCQPGIAMRESNHSNVDHASRQRYSDFYRVDRQLGIVRNQLSVPAQETNVAVVDMIGHSFSTNCDEDPVKAPSDPVNNTASLEVSSVHLLRHSDILLGEKTCFALARKQPRTFKQPQSSNQTSRK